jgi:hypothetical protein
MTATVRTLGPALSALLLALPPALAAGPPTASPTVFSRHSSSSLETFGAPYIRHSEGYLRHVQSVKRKIKNNGLAARPGNALCPVPPCTRIHKAVCQNSLRHRKPISCVTQVLPPRSGPAEPCREMCTFLRLPSRQIMLTKETRCARNHKDASRRT